MSLSITINNINDLTDAERAVLRMIVGDKQVTLTGPTATRQFIESIAGCGHPVSEDGRLACDKCSHDAAHRVSTSTVLRAANTRTPASANVDRQFVEALDAGKSFEGAHGTFTPVPSVPASAELDSAGLPWDKRIHSSSRAKVADGTWRKMRGVDEALVATVEAELRAVQAIPAHAPAAPVPMTPREIAEVWGDKLPPAPTLADVDAAPVPAQQVTYVGDGTGIHELGAAVVPGLNADPNEIPPAGCHPAPVPPAPTPTLAEMQAKLDAVEPPAPVFNIEQAPPIVPVPPAPTALTFADLMKHVTPMLVSNKLSQDKLLAVCAEFGLPQLAALGARPDLIEAVKARIDAEVGV